jgi:hypothetical protein
MDSELKIIYKTILGKYFYTSPDGVDKITSSGLSGKALRIRNAKKILEKLVNE